MPTSKVQRDEPDTALDGPERSNDNQLKSSGADWFALGESLWRGLRGLGSYEVEAWQRHSQRVGQPLSEEGLALWMERCQQGQCVVCGVKARGKFCGDHMRFEKTP